METIACAKKETPREEIFMRSDDDPGESAPPGVFDA